MLNEEQYQREKAPEQFIRALEIEVFDAFMSRALSIVREQDNNKSIADACRLADVALKAARGDSSMPGPASVDNGLKGLIEELHTSYEEFRAAQGETKSGEEEP